MWGDAQDLVKSHTHEHAAQRVPSEAPSRSRIRVGRLAKTRHLYWGLGSGERERREREAEREREATGYESFFLPPRVQPGGASLWRWGSGERGESSTRPYSRLCWGYMTRGMRRQGYEAPKVDSLKPRKSIHLGLVSSQLTRGSSSSKAWMSKSGWINSSSTCSEDGSYSRLIAL